MRKKLVAMLCSVTIAAMAVTGCGTGAKNSTVKKNANGAVEVDFWFSGGKTADSYIERAAAEMNTVQNLVEVATSDLNEQWAIFSQGALRVSARELEERVNTVKSDLDKMSAHIDLKTPKLRPWDDAQLGKLQDLLNEIE